MDRSAPTGTFGATAARRDGHDDHDDDDRPVPPTRRPDGDDALVMTLLHDHVPLALLCDLTAARGADVARRSSTPRASPRRGGGSETRRPDPGHPATGVPVPEGHTVHRQAREHLARFGGTGCASPARRAASPRVPPSWTAACWTAPRPTASTCSSASPASGGCTSTSGSTALDVRSVARAGARGVRCGCASRATAPSPTCAAPTACEVWTPVTRRPCSRPGSGPDPLRPRRRVGRRLGPAVPQPQRRSASC